MNFMLVLARPDDSRESSCIERPSQNPTTPRWHTGATLRRCAKALDELILISRPQSLGIVNILLSSKCCCVVILILLLTIPVIILLILGFSPKDVGALF